MEIIANAELAWANGPLRVPGTGNGKASRYVCAHCHYQVNGLYLVNCDSSQAGTWVCGSCRSELKPKAPQPEGLRKARLK